MLMLFLKREGFARAEYIRKRNLFGSIGKNCYYNPFTIPSEGNMISMGDNVVIGKRSGIDYT
jgi:acetyltransferase-like isoleucine patch superfamily enzyme